MELVEIVVVRVGLLNIPLLAIVLSLHKLMFSLVAFLLVFLHSLSLQVCRLLVVEYSVQEGVVQLVNQCVSSFFGLCLLYSHK